MKTEQEIKQRITRLEDSLAHLAQGKQDTERQKAAAFAQGEFDALVWVLEHIAHAAL